MNHVLCPVGTSPASPLAIITKAALLIAFTMSLRRTAVAIFTTSPHTVNGPSCGVLGLLEADGLVTSTQTHSKSGSSSAHSISSTCTDTGITEIALQGLKML